MLIGSIEGLSPMPAPARDGSVVETPNPPTLPQAVLAPGETPAPEAVKHAVAKANDALHALFQAVEFEYDAEAHITVIRLVDTQDKQVLRQIPTPEMLEISRALERMQTMLVRGKA